MFTEPLDVFFTDFAELITVNSVEVQAIFDAAYTIGLDVASVKPVARVKSADVAAAAVGHTAVVRGISYRVADMQPDGTGTTLLELERL